jgi:hypothetical protein
MAEGSPRERAVKVKGLSNGQEKEKSPKGSTKT